jgi:hypothetical protein
VRPAALSSTNQLPAGRSAISFATVADGVLVRETFEAESDNKPEIQRQGWQAILDKFVSHVEAKSTNR